jgi:hypothetical protein
MLNRTNQVKQWLLSKHQTSFISRIAPSEQEVVHPPRQQMGHDNEARQMKARKEWSILTAMFSFADRRQYVTRYM